VVQKASLRSENEPSFSLEPPGLRISWRVRVSILTTVRIPPNKTPSARPVKRQEVASEKTCSRLEWRRAAHRGVLAELKLVPRQPLRLALVISNVCGEKLLIVDSIEQEVWAV
jgi:hypothetical protein